jgi:LysM repeat protein
VSTYASKDGDTCTSIENQFNLQAGTIFAANAVLDCNNIWTDTPICIPDGPYVSTSSSTSPSSASDTTTPTPTPTCVSTYGSNDGDTCTSIEAQFGLVAGTIFAVNSFLDCNDIWTGTPICIPDGPYVSTSSTSGSSASDTATPTPTPTCVSTYASTDGDTCTSIENQFNLQAGTIFAANPILDCNDIWTNTPICIPDGPYVSTSSLSSSTDPTPTPTPTCKFSYVSEPNDTCSSIETAYNLVEGTIKAYNSFLTCDDIWTYTPICVPDGPYASSTSTSTWTSSTTSASPQATPGCTTQTYTSYAGETWYASSLWTPRHHP